MPNYFARLEVCFKHALTNGLDTVTLMYCIEKVAYYAFVDRMKDEPFCEYYVIPVICGNAIGLPRKMHENIVKSFQYC